VIADAQTVSLEGRYVANVRTNHLVVDAGPNRGGKAEAPTPGEYFLTGIASCAVVVMAGEARRLGIAVDHIGASAEIVKEPENDHSIAAIRLAIETLGVSDADARRLLDIYLAECPVYAVVRRGTTLSVTLNGTEIPARPA
jgi:uncharacterized OsmC-like protein